MSIVCAEGERCASRNPVRIAKYKQLLLQIPAPGFGYGDTMDSLINFTDPQHLRYTVEGRAVGVATVAGNDGPLGIQHFPKANSLTNFWRLRDDYFICMCDDAMWALDWKTMKWRTVTIQDLKTSESTDKEDILVTKSGSPDCMKLIRFLPSRADCTRVETRSFTFEVNDLPANQQESPASNLSESNTSSTNEGETAVISEFSELSRSSTPTSRPGSTSEVRSKRIRDRGSPKCNLFDVFSSSTNTSIGKAVATELCRFRKHPPTQYIMLPCCHVGCSTCIEEAMKEFGYCTVCGQDVEHARAPFVKEN